MPHGSGSRLDQGRIRQEGWQFILIGPPTRAIDKGVHLRLNVTSGLKPQFLEGPG